MGNVFIREICILKNCDQLEEDEMEKYLFFGGNLLYKMENQENELNFNDGLAVYSSCSPAVYITLSLQYIFTVSLLGNVL
jgi:hypothetical protein